MTTFISRRIARSNTVIQPLGIVLSYWILLCRKIREDKAPFANFKERLHKGFG